MLSLCKLPYPTHGITLPSLSGGHVFHYTLEELGLCEGDCVEVTATTDRVQNKVGVEENGELVAYLPVKDCWWSAYYSNELAWVTVVRIHVGTGECVR